MAVNFTDIYQAREFVRELQKKHIDIDDEPLEMGIFGYLGEVHSNILQNSAQSAAENALEALPTKARYSRNVLIHAHTIGLTVDATPSVMNVILYLPESKIETNLDGNNNFVIDKDYEIMIGDYAFHLEYDIILKKVTLPDHSIVYTAMYDMSVPNPLSNINSPYIQTVGRINVSGSEIIAIQTRIRQVKYGEQEILLYTSNPLINKSFNFKYSDQLAYFTISVEENGETHNLTPVYDGIIDQVSDAYINFSYLGDNTIRCLFVKDSYQPRSNSKVIIKHYTTKGSLGNFKYNKNIQVDFKSTRFNYRNIWMIVKPMGESFNGEDSKSIVELKKLIPGEHLSRGTITNTKDLENFFNSINTSTRKIYFLKKLDSIKRVYYAYVAIKHNNLILPTNTIDISLTRTQFDMIELSNYILLPGNCIYYNRSNDGEIVTNYLYKTDKMALYRKNGFLYFNPFLMVINKNPFYVSYLINIINVTRAVEFTYINQSSPIQYILNDVEWKREYFTDRNTYKLSLNLVSNIDSKEYDSVVRLTETDNIRIIALLRNEDGDPYRYLECSTTTFNQSTSTISCQFQFTTDNSMDGNMNLKLNNVRDINSTYIVEGYFPEITDIDIFVLVKYDNYEFGGKDFLKEYVPGLSDWTCTNQYKIQEGVPLYYNYSQVISTFINVTETTDNNLKYTIKKVPVVSYDYINSESKLHTFIEQMELVRSYILYKMGDIEDGFGIDIKLFNSFGPAKFFNINGTAYLDNVSLSLNFRVKPRGSATDRYLNDILVFVRDYIQDFDNIGDLDFPNLQTAVENEFADQIYYFEYRSFNSYGPGDQHIHREDFETDISKVPEILSIRITKDDLPDINIEEITY